MIELTKKELEQKYYNMYNYELCEELGITNSTLMKLLREAGIPLKGSGNIGEPVKITDLEDDN